MYYCIDTPLLLTSDGDYVVARTAEAWRQYLAPPAPEREFLISPPGSPPVGWEPKEEDGPNQETLAHDLIEALQRLATEPAESVDPASDALAALDQEGASVVILPPATTHTSTVPGVTVHTSEGTPAPPPSTLISDVKATVESLIGAERAMPTARPPL